MFTRMFIGNVQNRPVPRERKQVSGCRGLREGGEWGVAADGCGVSVRGDACVLELGVMIA